MHSLVTVYSDVLRGSKNLAKYFASWYDAVLKLEIIVRIGSSSTALQQAGAESAGYYFLYFCSENLDFIFLETFCIFLSEAAVESAVTFLKHSVFNNAIDISIYLVVCKITTPLPLSCFKITMFFLDRLYITFFDSYGTLI